LNQARRQVLRVQALEEPDAAAGAFAQDLGSQRRPADAHHHEDLRFPPEDLGLAPHGMHHRRGRGHVVKGMARVLREGEQGVAKTLHGGGHALEEVRRQVRWGGVEKVFQV
jgi:hypothetical protein